ncbi:MAG TPA: hypothetical protein VMW17_24295 [Candidatus Binatia bacterium]|nr:hypothetical protein [Candidatus Binatia bacterium]
MAIRTLAGDAPEAVFAFLDTTVSARGPAHWRWKYRVGAVTEPTALYFDGADGQVLGFIGMMPTALHAGGATCPVAWFMDWHVNQSERTVGVGLGLLRKAEALAGTLLTLQGSLDTRAMLPELGWRHTDSARTWIRPLSARFIGDWLSKRFAVAPRALAGAAAEVLVLHYRASPPAGMLPHTLREVTRFSAEYDAVWKARAIEFAPVMTRDSRYLNYVAAEYPDGGYRLQLLCAGDAPIGHLITRLDDVDGFRRGRLVDLLWPRGNRDLLLWMIQTAAWDLQTQGADYIDCVASVPDLADALERERFDARRSVPLWHHRLPATMPNPERWYITFLDCDRAYR